MKAKYLAVFTILSCLLIYPVTAHASILSTIKNIISPAKTDKLLGARTDNYFNLRLGTYLESASPTGYDLLINGVSKYLNFGSISGSSGYGFRDNSGTMEYKNSGGAWAGVGTGGGGSIAQLGQIGDVSTSTLAYGHLLMWNGSVWQDTATSSLGIVGAGTVTSVDMTVPTGFTISGNPVTTSGTLALGLDALYNIPLTSSTSNWQTAFSWGNHAGLYPTFAYASSTYAMLSSNYLTQAYASSSYLLISDAFTQAKASTTFVSRTDWTTHDNYPSACSAGQYVSAIGDTLTCATPAGAGTVTSVDMSVPTGLTIGGNPITSAGTLALSLTSGYNIPLTASTTDWNTAYLNRITSASSPLSINNNAISISLASSTANGYLSSTDWATFNGKINLSSLSATAPISYNNGTGAFTFAVGSQATNDLLYYNGSAWTRFAKGNNGDVLSTDVSTGNLAWKATSTLGFTGGGSGTVNSGTLGYIGYYAANGTAISATSSVFIASSQYVGIGTTTPDKLLTVWGDGSFGTRGATDSILNLANNWYLGNKNSDSKLYLATSSALTTGNLMTFVNSGLGMIGIGTSSPSVMLSVGATTGSQFLVNSSGVISDGTWNADIIGMNYGGLGFDASGIAKGGLIIGSGAGTSALLAVGTNGYVLTASSTATNGIEWRASSGGSGTPGGSDTQVQYNTLGSFGGNSGMTYASTTNILTLAGGVNVAAGGYYQYNGVSMSMASTTLNNWFSGGAGNLTTTGTNNVGFGEGTMKSLTTSSNHNTAIGYQSLYTSANGVSDNAVIGYQAMYNGVNPSQSSCVGYQCLYKLDSGAQNTCIGYDCLRQLTSGNYNYTGGAYAGYGLTSGSGNVFLGYSSGYNETTASKKFIVDYDFSQNHDSSNYYIYGDMTGGATSFIDFNSKVGIGTSTPQASLTVAIGDVYVSSSTKGVILKDTVTATCYRVQVTSGVLVPTSVTCPE